MRAKGLIVWGCTLVLSVLLCACNNPQNYTAKEERELSSESYAKTQEWFNLNKPGVSLNGCGMFYDGQLGSVVRGKYVYRKLHGNGETYTDYSFDYVYDYKNNVMYDNSLYKSLEAADDNVWDALERLYGRGLGLEQTVLSGCNFEIEIPYVVYEDPEKTGNLSEKAAFLQASVLPVELSKDELADYIEQKCKEDTVDWTVLIFSEDIYDIDELNPEFLRDYPYIGKVKIEGTTYKWNIQIDESDESESGKIIRVTKEPSSGEGESESWEYDF